MQAYEKVQEHPRATAAQVALAAAAALAAILLMPRSAAAGIFEVSAGASFNQSTYSTDSFTWERRWGLSFGYHLNEHSEFELSFQDVVNRNKLDGFEDTTFHDQIYSANWVQSLTGKDFPVQPYFKLGVGQLNRDASGSYGPMSGMPGAVPPSQYDALTVILGAGLRVHLTRSFGLRGEATTYLTGGSIGTWQNNFALSLGFSLYF